MSWKAAIPAKKWLKMDMNFTPKVAAMNLYFGADWSRDFSLILGNNFYLFSSFKSFPGLESHLVIISLKVGFEAHSIWDRLSLYI